MIDLISVKDSLPTKDKELLVKIGNKYFIAESRMCGGYSFSSDRDEKIIYSIYRYRKDENAPWEYGGEWIVPSHFKEPSHWAYISCPYPEIKDTEEESQVIKDLRKEATSHCLDDLNKFKEILDKFCNV